MQSSSIRIPVRTTVLFVMASVAAVVLWRVGVGYQPHSGQDNYQGPSSSGTSSSGTSATTTTSTTTSTSTSSSSVYGGDYEAQRHWMELTLHLPIGEWYYYDVSYWGLDYPPLTAYHSYLCGWIGHFVFQFVDAVALDTSRGYEDPLHKAYMRSTVLVSDLLCYTTVIGMFVVMAATASLKSSTSTLTHSRTSTTIITNTNSSMAPYYQFLYCMLQPAMVLIDHGHFQYNSVALGLSLWSVYFLTRRNHTNYALSMKYCVIGSVFFCAALSFKQMTLYYAPAIFCYLLGRCCATPTSTSDGSPKSRNEGRCYLSSMIYRVAVLGITVVATLALLWWPFIVYGPNDTTYMERAQHMFERIIPIRRGLFEGKVSNLWCALSVSPFRIRQRIPTSYQPVAALLLTLILLIPSSAHLFNVGRRCHHNKFNQSNFDANYFPYDRQQLLWGMTNSALAFFLASFQVHEKSLLLALAPCSLLIIPYCCNNNNKNDDHPDKPTTTMSIDTTFVNWFSIVTAWTLWPLLQIDRLQTAYFCTMVVFLSMIGLYQELTTTNGSHNMEDRSTMSTGFFQYYSIYHFDWIPTISYAMMILLHIAEFIVTVPKHLPDLFPVLWSVVGCGFCCLAYVVTCWHMMYNGRSSPFDPSQPARKLKEQ